MPVSKPFEMSLIGHKQRSRLCSSLTSLILLRPDVDMTRRVLQIVW